MGRIKLFLCIFPYLSLEKTKKNIAASDFFIVFILQASFADGIEKGFPAKHFHLESLAAKVPILAKEMKFEGIAIFPEF